jgi:hypothetical protein
MIVRNASPFRNGPSSKPRLPTRNCNAADHRSALRWCIQQLQVHLSGLQCALALEGLDMGIAAQGDIQALVADLGRYHLDLGGLRDRVDQGFDHVGNAVGVEADQITAAVQQATHSLRRKVYQVLLLQQQQGAHGTPKEATAATVMPLHKISGLEYTLDQLKEATEVSYIVVIILARLRHMSSRCQSPCAGMKLAKW